MRADTVHSLLLLRDTPWEAAMKIIISRFKPSRSRASRAFAKLSLGEHLILALRDRSERAEVRTRLLTGSHGSRAVSRGSFRDLQTHRHRLIEQNRAEEQDCAEYLVPRNHLEHSKNLKAQGEGIDDTRSLPSCFSFHFTLFSSYTRRGILSLSLSLEYADPPGVSGEKPEALPTFSESLVAFSPQYRAAW